MHSDRYFFIKYDMIRFNMLLENEGSSISASTRTRPRIRVRQETPFFYSISNEQRKMFPSLVSGQSSVACEPPAKLIWDGERLGPLRYTGMPWDRTLVFGLHN